MGMGIVDESEFNDELDASHEIETSINDLSDSNNLGSEPSSEPIAKVININEGLGRGIGNRAVPEELKKVIGENAAIEGSQETKELTRRLGISDSSLSAYKHGVSSTASYNKPNKPLISHIVNAKARTSSRARSKLNLALGQITEDKFEGTKLRDIAGVAQAMSSIIKNLEPAIDNNNNQTNVNVQYVVHAPKIKEEEDFNIVEVTE